MSRPPERRRVLVFVVAFNAEHTIQWVLRRIPASLQAYDTHILVIDDSSNDRTFARAAELQHATELPFPLTVLVNPVNQGYGGNQKIGFQYAIAHGFDVVALIHGDGQYAPECLPELIAPLLNGEADAVFGSRMLTRFGALRGGMPLYKYLGNKILTALQNRMLGTSLSEFHSGYRLYAVDALRRIPFERNANEFHFDTEIIIQLVRAGLRVKELPIPTYYGNEICHVNGVRYALEVLKVTALSRAQDVGILYEPKFALAVSAGAQRWYESKLDFDSPHSLALQRVAAGSRVLDLGCASGYVAAALRAKHCQVVGVDRAPLADPAVVDRFVLHDLDAPEMPVDPGDFDYVLLLDVIEHLNSPETFAERLRGARSGAREPVVIVSTGNVAFVVVRLMLLLGCFNYGPRGILDLTHRRLFTFAALRTLFRQAGFRIDEMRGVPFPFPLVLGDTRVSRWLLRINKVLLRLAKTLFAYQIFMVARPLPTLEWLLGQAVAASDERRRGHEIVVA
jgi:glycosyltransferase involved in cell wall biosynthesis